MCKPYDEFVLDAFREFESEVGVFTENEIEEIIQEKPFIKIERWLVRAGFDVSSEYEAYRRNE